MNTILALAFLAFLPICTGLNCYLCASGLSGCNDPFSSTAANVTQTGSIAANTACVKALANSIVSRYGAPSASCTAIPFLAGVGMACCTTDLCNGAQGLSQISLLTILSFVIILCKFY